MIYKFNSLFLNLLPACYMLRCDVLTSVLFLLTRNDARVWRTSGNPKSCPFSMPFTGSLGRERRAALISEWCWAQRL